MGLLSDIPFFLFPGYYLKVWEDFMDILCDAVGHRLGLVSEVGGLGTSQTIHPLYIIGGYMEENFSWFLNILKLMALAHLAVSMS
jgi:hypothetical protein